VPRVSTVYRTRHAVSPSRFLSLYHENLCMVCVRARARATTKCAPSRSRAYTHARAHTHTYIHTHMATPGYACIYAVPTGMVLRTVRATRILYRSIAHMYARRSFRSMHDPPAGSHLRNTCHEVLKRRIPRHLRSEIEFANARNNRRQNLMSPKRK